MAKQNAFTITNVALPNAPPTRFVPNANGIAVPTGGATYLLTVISSRYPAGSTADLGVEYEYAGAWQSDVAAGGFGLGPSSSGGSVTGVANTTNPTLTTRAKHFLEPGQQITISGVLGAAGVNGTWTVAAVPDALSFTITTAAPGIYDSGGTVTTWTSRLSSSIGTNAVPYPTNVRLRVDAIAAGTLDSVSLDIN